MATKYKPKFSYIDRLKRSMLHKIRIRNRRLSTLKFLKETEFSKILIMNASPFMTNMFQQRPHHFLHFWAKNFDIVLYRSYLIDEPVKYQDNIYLVPYIPCEKFLGKDIYYYMSSVGCVAYKTFLKLKKNGYKIIYDYYDEISGDITCPANALKVHKNMQKLDPHIIIATSDRLLSCIKKDHPKKDVLLVKNGVTLEDFQVNSDEIPEDLKPILKQRRKIVGFYGYIAKWVNVKLLHLAAEKYPKYNFVIIGKVYFNTKFNHKKHPNLHFLGHKNYKDLINYSKYFDCAMIPFKHGNLAKATSPNKLFEYMAVGLPTVCTRDLVECKGYDGVLMSANNEEFIKNIAKAIELSKDNNVREKLKMYAAQNTWDKKADEIFEKIKELM